MQQTLGTEPVGSRFPGDSRGEHDANVSVGLTVGVLLKKMLLNTAVPRSITFVTSTFLLAENAQSSYSRGRPGGLGCKDTTLLLTGSGSRRAGQPAPEDGSTHRISAGEGGRQEG